ncbi:hypothetical protein OPV22_007420 [Ensete ventricosum]|uniref:Uncharacterized protein n=1 Tax=Ensete ventricosum TaxID=4639 RepID=A0AAV8RRP7_ENSVE|nr:hypothetical protein OPV22_007420 [Ensete ventricosum]
MPLTTESRQRTWNHELMGVAAAVILDLSSREEEERLEVEEACTLLHHHHPRWTAVNGRTNGRGDIVGLSLPDTGEEEACSELQSARRRCRLSGGTALLHRPHAQLRSCSRNIARPATAPRLDEQGTRGRDLHASVQWLVGASGHWRVNRQYSASINPGSVALWVAGGDSGKLQQQQMVIARCYQQGNEM